MHLNVKFLQVLFTIYISFESINSGDSDKNIPLFLMSKIQFLKSNIQLFPRTYICIAKLDIFPFTPFICSIQNMPINGSKQISSRNIKFIAIRKMLNEKLPRTHLLPEKMSFMHQIENNEKSI